MGLSSYQVIGILALFLVGILGGGAVFSGMGADDVREVTVPAEGDDSSSTDAGEDAELSIETYDATEDSTVSVSTSFYAWADGFQIIDGDATTSGERDQFEGFVTGDEYTAIAFDDQYPYAETVEGTVESTTERKDMNVYEAAAAEDILVNILDEDGDATTGPLSLGDEEEVNLEGVEVDVDDSNVGYNPKMVVVDYSDNIDSVEMPNAQSETVPEAVDAELADADDAFLPSGFNPAEGEPQLGGFEETETGNLVVTAEEGGTTTEDEITVAVMDLAPFINDHNELEYGVEDSDENNVGVDIQTQTLDLE